MVEANCKRRSRHRGCTLSHSAVLRLLARLRPIKWRAAGAYAVTVAATLLALAVPLALRAVIDTAVGAEDAPSPGVLDGWSSQARLVAGALVVVALSLAGGVLSYGQRYGTAWVGRMVAARLRRDVFDRLIGLDLAFHDRASVGQLMTRVTDDTEKVRRFTAVGVGELLSIAVLLVGAVVVLVRSDPILAAVALGPIPFVATLAVVAARTLRPRFVAVQQATGGLTARLQESLTNVRLLQAFAAEPRTLQAYSVDNEVVYTRRLGVARVFTSLFPAMSAILGLATAAVLLVGGLRVLDGVASIGTLVLFVSYIALLGQPIRRLGFFLNLAAQAAASATRLFELLDERPVLVEPDRPRRLDDVRGAIEVDGVDFSYEPGRPVLHDVRLRVAPGEHVALVGPSGGGKSALAALLVRLYDPDAGHVRLDGVDVRDLALDQLRGAVGYVEQGAFLYSASVHDNVAFAAVTDADRDDVVWACRLAGADAFVRQLPDGYDTVVGDRGVTLSGGQRQRLALARTLIRRPTVLVLDDATSAVDAETEARVVEALADLDAGAGPAWPADRRHHRPAPLDGARRGPRRRARRRPRRAGGHRTTSSSCGTGCTGSCSATTSRRRSRRERGRA